MTVPAGLSGHEDILGVDAVVVAHSCASWDPRSFPGRSELELASRHCSFADKWSWKPLASLHLVGFKRPRLQARGYIQDLTFLFFAEAVSESQSW